MVTLNRSRYRQEESRDGDGALAVLANASKRSDLVWGVTSQFLQHGSVLLVLPLIVTRMPVIEVGLWFVFMAIQSLVSILDFGFAPTFSRAYAFVYAGAKDIAVEGLPVAGPTTDAGLLHSLISASRILYLGTGLVVALVLAGPGSIYVHGLLRESGLAGPQWLAWAVFATAIIVNVTFSWYTPLLTGSGRIADGYKVIIVNRGAFAIGAAIGLLSGGGLLLLASAYLGSAILARAYARRICGPLISPKGRGEGSNRRTLTTLRRLWPNAYRAGIVSLGSFLISRFSVLVVSTYLGLAVAASYSITMHVFAVVSSVSQVGLVTFLPRLAGARVRRDQNELRRLVTAALLLMAGVFVAGGGAVLAFGNQALTVLGSKTLLLDRSLLGLLAVIYLLEANHSLCAAVITTSNTVPFMRAAIWSGAAVCLMSLGAAWLGMGLLAIIGIQGGVQLLYNNWKWPLDVYRDLRPRV